MAGTQQEYVLKVTVRGDKDLQRMVSTAGAMGAKMRTAEQQTVKSFSRIGSEVKTLAAGFAGLYAVMASTRTISEFQRSMSAVAAVTKATGSELSLMESKARQLGATTMFTASQAAEAMEFLGRAGFKATQIVAAMPTTLNLAAAAKLDMAAAADITAKSMAGFGLAAEEAERVADTFAAVAANANTNVSEMGDAMKFAAPAARSLGLSLEDTAAAVGVLSNAGISGTMAGTSLRIMFKNLISPTKSAQAALASIGLTAQDVNPQAHSLVEIFQTLHGAGLDTAKAFEIFDTRAANGALALIELSDELGRLTEVTNNAEGEARRMANTMQNNLFGSIRRVQSAAQEFVLAFGDGFVKPMQTTNDAFAQLVASLNTVGSGLGKIASSALAPFGAVLKVIAEHGAVVAEALKVLVAIKLAQWASMAAAALITRLTPAMIGASTAGTRLGVALLNLQPLLAGIAAGAIWLNQKIDEWADSSEAAIARNVELSASFANMIEPVRSLQRALADANAEIALSTVQAAAKQLPELAKNLNAARAAEDKAKAAVATAEATRSGGLDFGVAGGQRNIDSAKVAAARTRLAEATAAVTRAEGLWNAANKAIIASGTRVKVVVEENNRQLGMAGDVLDDLEKKLRAVVDEYDPLGAKVRALEGAQDALNTVIANGRDATGLYAATLAKVTAELAKARAAVDRFKKSNEGVYKSGKGAVMDLTDQRDRRDRSLAIDPEVSAAEYRVKLEQEANQLIEAATQARLQNLTTYGRLNEEARRMREQQARFNELAEGGNTLMMRAAEAAGLLADQLEESADNARFDSWRTALEAMIPLVARFSEGLANALGNAIGIAQSFRDANKAMRSGDMGGMLTAGLGIGSGIASTAIGFGLFKGNRGKGQYGGQLSGDYADVGGALGGAAGAAIAGGLTGGLGAGAGALIGGAIGTVVGGLIKQGADEGIARIRDYGEGAVATLVKNEGGLGSVVLGVGRGIIDSITEAMANMGGDIASLPGVDIKLRDDVFTVVVGGVKGKFEEMEDALKFGVLESLKQGVFTGLGENVTLALKNSVAQTLEGLMDDLDFAQMIDRAGVDELQVSLETLSNTMNVWLDRAVELGLKGEQVGVAISQQWQNVYDNLAGIELTAEERAARNVEVFNAQRAIFIAEWTLKKLDIDNQIEALETQGEITSAQAQIFVGKIDAEYRFLEAEIEALNIRGRITNASIAQLNALRAASAAIGQVLANMPPELTQAVALKGLGGGIKSSGFGGGRSGSGSNRRERWATALDRLAEAIENAKFSERTTALTEQERAVEAANAFRVALAGAQSNNLTALEKLPDAMNQLLEISKTISGGGGGLGFLGFGDSFSQLFDAVIGASQAIVDAGTPKKMTEEKVVHDRRLNDSVRAHKQVTDEFRIQSAIDAERARESMRDQVRSLNDGFDKVARKLDNIRTVELA